MTQRGYQISIFASLFAVVALALFGASSNFFQSIFSENVPVLTGGELKTRTVSFSDSELKLSFQYERGPNGLTMDYPPSPLHTMTFSKAGDVHVASVGSPTLTPATITVTTHENVQKVSTAKWLQDSASPLYLARTGEASVITLPVGEALFFPWAKGSLRGEIVVVPHKDSFHVFSVSFENPNDPIRENFSQLLASLAFHD